VAYRKERYRLRLFGLSADMQAEIRAALPGPEVKSRRSGQETNILLFDLHEAMDLSALLRTVDTLQLEPEHFAVSASVVTTSDNGGIDLPAYVLDLIHRARCSVGFSFVDIGPDDEDGSDCELQDSNG
jgi:hypothetical protein